MFRVIAILGYVLACAAILVILYTLDQPTQQWPAALCLALLVGLHVARTRHWRRRWEDTQTALWRAETDPVTALPVRGVAERRLDLYPSPDRTIALVDVNDLHTINQRGHNFGDAYLRAVADALFCAGAGDDDLVARLGGDEFVVISRRDPAEVAAALADRLRRQTSLGGTAVVLAVSIGIACIDGDPRTALACADRAMFTAKRTGSGIEHYDPARDGQPTPPAGRPATRLRDRHRTNHTGH